MAEEKHRMLYQGQDASQEDPQKQRPMSLSPSEPPTYDDAMNDAAPSGLASFGYSADRRRTFFAEPQHLRNGLEEVAHVEVADGDGPPMQEGLSSPPVRDFFILTPQPKLGKQAMEIVCPACGQRGFTRLKRSSNATTHIWALWLCAFGWCCCACLCPYLWNGCRTTNHYCSACEIFLGAHYPAGCCCCRL
ncbi:lipopolysaccharide-induced tumor necrosis factor-alpha factor homolog isoform X2 [Drosophila suzukii]|uniref:Lipopolysaccharide-induced tumor necrosis factor-alpha factor homolog isoform X2 n=1 Tax=Drosophila suzukii TaxID=28584 RepID=A0AB40DH37_DROSZ